MVTWGTLTALVLDDELFLLKYNEQCDFPIVLQSWIRALNIVLTLVPSNLKIETNVVLFFCNP